MRYFLCISKALVKHGLKFAGKLAQVDAFVDFGMDVYGELREANQEDAIRQQIQEAAQLSHEQAVLKARQTVEAVAPQATPEQKQEMVDYLTVVPATIRQSLKRVADPTGQTVPGSTRFRRVEDLLPFLPRRLPQFKPGDQPIAGVDLELVELLGRGGFGEVWKARNPYMTSAEPVVLKFTTDESAIKILRNEAGVLDRVMKHGKHPGIVPLLKTYLRAQYPCLEYEFVPGFDLSQLIARWHTDPNPDWRTILPWFVQLVEIVAFAHAADPPIVHCDLKPANIFVHQMAGGKARLRVLDFGIGGLAASQAFLDTHRSQSSKSVLMTQAARGAHTPLYASPQQKTRGRDQSPDPRDDIHALGVVWYQMMTGDLAMTSMPTDWQDELAAKNVPDDMAKLMGRCFSAREERRPNTGAVLLKELIALSKPASAAPVIKNKMPMAELAEIEVAELVEPEEIVVHVPRAAVKAGDKMTLKVSIPEPKIKPGTLLRLRLKHAP